MAVKKIKSLSAQRAVASLGRNIKTARTKRRIPVKEFAERIGVSERTVIRLEKGDEGVSLGTLAMACLVLGELDLISGFLDPAADDTGLLIEQQKLPKRIDRSRGASSASPKKEKPSHGDADDDRHSDDHDDDDDDGVAF